MSADWYALELLTGDHQIILASPVIQLVLLVLEELILSAQSVMV
jgi:hypothetical protein